MQYQVEKPYIKIGLSNGIIYCVYADNLNLDLTVAKLSVRARLGLQAGRSYPVLVDMRGLKSTTKDARAYLSKEGVEGIKAGALIIRSPLTRMLGNIFLVIDKPGVPTKLFSNQADAEVWLKSYL